MATSGSFIGFNTDGSAKIIAAIDAYVKKINSVSFSATAAETQAFAKGSAPYNAMKAIFTSTDTQMANLVTAKLKPLRDRISALSNQYKNNDNTQANTLNTKAKSILKS